MNNGPAPELGRLRDDLFDIAVPPTFTYTSETWTVESRKDMVSASLIALWKGQCSERQVRRNPKLRELRAPPTNEEQRYQRLHTSRNRKPAGPDTLCNIVMTIGPRRL
ncbi:hypothetical protein V3C99_002113 [Haemonchus contortus]|uniref:Uncharacterized protein n=1 Tax=Haemonchus contortus TaxID=6289 RepID=A0A7I4YAK7_HAECO